MGSVRFFNILLYIANISLSSVSKNCFFIISVVLHLNISQYLLLCLPGVLYYNKRGERETFIISPSCPHSGVPSDQKRRTSKHVHNVRFCLQFIVLFLFCFVSLRACACIMFLLMSICVLVHQQYLYFLVLSSVFLLPIKRSDISRYVVLLPDSNLD